LKARNSQEWKPFQSWNWNSARKKGIELFGKKTFVLLLVCLAVTIGFAAMYADPNNGLFHSYHPNLVSNDPYNVIWSAVSANGLTPFNTASSGSGSVSVLNNCDGSVSCIFMTGDSSGATHLTTLALTKVSVGDLSIANSKNLFFQMIESQSGTLCQYCNFGYYLTMNGTMPNTANYDPQTDPSVVLLNRQDCDNTCGFSSAHIATEIYLLRNIGQKDTIASEFANSQCVNGSSGSLFMCLVTTLASTGTKYVSNFILNYTGTTNGNACGASQPNPVNGPGCSSLSVGTTSYTTTTIFPWSNLQAQQLYFGIFIMPGNNGVNFSWDLDDISTDAFSMDINLYTPLPPLVNAPQVDTGGFFGPIIKALINLGIWILNSILQGISFIAPSIVSAFSFLETIWVLVLNAIGNILGFGNVGTDLQTLIGNVLNFFTQQVPTIFTNTGALFARFFDVNSVYFSWLPTALNIALTIATLAINGVVFVLTIIDFSFRLVGGVYLIVLLSLFLVYTGDDALGGILVFLETTQWLILGPLGWLCKILNFSLDIVTYLIGLIPKPFIQMVAHSIPRIPIIETSARFVNPSFDLAAIRNGNMLAVWAWFVDFTFLAWYNGVTPALPGSLGFLLPGMPASTFAALRGFLPMLEICLIVVSALAFIIWPVNKMFSMISLDLDVLDFDMSPGRKISQTGLGAVRVKIGKKRLQGRLSKKLEKRKQEKLEKETRRVLGEGGAEKVREEVKRLKEEFERTKRQAELQKERNQ